MVAVRMISGFVLFLVSCVTATSRTSPPSGAYVVSKSPSSGEYSTISAAVAALPSGSSSEVIFIYAGTYEEQVYIDRDGPVTIYGYTSNTASYADNEVTITYGATASSAGSDDASGTLRVHQNNFYMYNINVKNSYGEGVQAIAYSNYGSETAAYACAFYGYQDTLLAEEGTQVYLNGYIEGSIDFIFGQRANAYFQGNTIGVLGGDVTITASGRSSDDSTMYVLNKNTIKLASDGSSSVTDGKVYYGRPWGAYAKVIFLNTVADIELAPALWQEWSSSTPNTADSYLADYETSGSGADGLDRASFAKELTSSEAADYSISDVLGSSYTSWVDSDYL